MLLADVVETSQRIAATTKRLEKTGLLASLIKRLRPEEVEVAVAYLSGAAPQGRIGIGYAALRGVTTAECGESVSRIARSRRYARPVRGGERFRLGAKKA